MSVTCKDLTATDAMVVLDAWVETLQRAVEENDPELTRRALHLGRVYQATMNCVIGVAE